MPCVILIKLKPWPKAVTGHFLLRMITNDPSVDADDTAPITSPSRLLPAPRRMIPTGDVDADAEILALQIGGQPSVRIEGFGNREFDAVSDRFVAQTTRAQTATTNPHNFLSRPRRRQIRETLSAARQTGREALFDFRGVHPHQDVMDFILRNAQQRGVRARIIRTR